MPTINELKAFLRTSVAHTYAGDGKEIKPQRPGFTDLEYQEGDWYLRDSYTGHYQAPGMSVVYYMDKPYWTMSYSGKMHEDKYDLALDTYGFLKNAMLQKDLREASEVPVRGPSEYVDGDWKYVFEFEGDMKCFLAKERILYKNEEVFFQDVIGGLVINR